MNKNPGSNNQRTTVHWIAYLCFSLFILQIIVPGCKPVGPDYIAPSPVLPDTWENKISLALEKEPVTDLENWWTVFNDTVLNSLIEQAKANNTDLQKAYSRVIAARAELTGRKADMFPTSQVQVDMSASKMSDYGPLAELKPEGGFQTQAFFGMGIGALWEIDVFGRIRRSIESSKAGYDVSVEDYYDVMVTLLSEVALNYVIVRSNQELIENTNQNINIQTEILELATYRYNAGLVSYLDVVQANSNLLETKSSIPGNELEVYLAANRIALLLGTINDSLNPGLFVSGTLPQPSSDINTGIPCEILRQRPDIRAAERNIARLNAQIGVATADLYPTFALSGFLGLDSKSVTTLFSVPALNWNISLPVKWQIFNRKQIKANIQRKKQETLQAYLTYDQIVLNAYAEVNNSITSYNLHQEKRNILQEALVSNYEAVQLVQTQYESGLTDFQNVMDTERSVFRQENNLIETETQTVFDLIKIYKGLGGGWPIPEDTLASPAQ